MENVRGAVHAGTHDNGVSSCYVFKSRLQEYAQKAGISTPVYDTVKEGPSHEPIFRSSVIVNDIRYDSLPGFFNRKAAEQSAAEVALLELRKSGNMSECIPHPVHETGLCKNLLQEYAQKMNFPIPSYICAWDGVPGQSFFKCTVEIGGIQYIGAAARTKKEAEIKAARTALLAIQSSSSETEANLNPTSPYTVLPGKRKAKEPSPQSETSKSLKTNKTNNFKKRPPRRKFPRSRGPKFTENEQGTVDADGATSIQAESPGSLAMLGNTDWQGTTLVAMGVESCMGQQSFPVSDQFTSPVGLVEAYDQVARQVATTIGGDAMRIESGMGAENFPMSGQLTSQAGSVEAHSAVVYDQVGRQLAVTVGGGAMGIDPEMCPPSFVVSDQFMSQVGPVEVQHTVVYDQVSRQLGTTIGGGDQNGAYFHESEERGCVKGESKLEGPVEAHGAMVYDQVTRQLGATIGGGAQNHETIGRGCVKQEIGLEGPVEVHGATAYDQVARQLGVTIGGGARIHETVDRGYVKQEFELKVPGDGKHSADPGHIDPGVGFVCSNQGDPVQGNGTTAFGHAAPNGSGEWHAGSNPPLQSGNYQE